MTSVTYCCVSKGTKTKARRLILWARKVLQLLPCLLHALPEARHKLKTLQLATLTLQATGSYVRETDSIEVSNRVANGFVFKLEPEGAYKHLHNLGRRLYNHKKTPWLESASELY
jgi:hypothetical protein